VEGAAGAAEESIRVSMLEKHCVPMLLAFGAEVAAECSKIGSRWPKIELL
jgi:hypothetical protein